MSTSSQTRFWLCWTRQACLSYLIRASASLQFPWLTDGPVSPWLLLFLASCAVWDRQIAIRLLWAKSHEKHSDDRRFRNHSQLKSMAKLYAGLTHRSTSSCSTLYSLAVSFYGSWGDSCLFNMCSGFTNRVFGSRFRNDFKRTAASWLGMTTMRIFSSRHSSLPCGVSSRGLDAHHKTIWNAIGVALSLRVVRDSR